MTRHPHIVVIGSFAVGVTVRLPRMPHSGETLNADLYHMGVGGKGSNVALAATRLGARVTLVERVGDDRFAEMAYTLYEREGIDPLYVTKTVGESTGVGLVYLTDTGENAIGLYRGANLCLTAEDIKLAEPAIASANCLTVQLEVPDEAVFTAIQLARKYSVPVILNPAPARKLPLDLLKEVHILTPNIHEACGLLDRPDTSDLDIYQGISCAREFVLMGVEHAVITMGENGAVVCSKNGNSIHQRSIPVTVVDTVGAGDSFNAGLAVAIAQKLSIKLAVCHAVVSGALATTELGIENAMPNRNDIANSISKLPEATHLNHF